MEQSPFYGSLSPGAEEPCCRSNCLQVDVFIPGLDIVGGFSLSSTPRQLPLVQLAVKKANHPPAHWLYSQAKVGDEVGLRVGGSFYHDVWSDKHAATRDLVFLAGGVGVSPLRSIFRDFIEWMGSSRGRTNPARATLVFSAASAAELAFREEFVAAQRSFGASRVRLFFTITKEGVSNELSASDYFDGAYVHQGRVEPDVIHRAVAPRPGSQSHRSFSPHVFLCGPPPLVDGAVPVLQDLGIHEHRIRYEKWW